MRRGVWLLVLGVLGAVLGVASAHATVELTNTTGLTIVTTTTDTTSTETTTTETTTTSDTTTTSETSTTTDTTTTTDTDTTGTTTTTGTTSTTPSYGHLEASSLHAGCVGAGVAAIMRPSHRVLGLGTPASNLGASGYPDSASAISLGSSAVRGSTCADTTITLTSVALFQDAVTARQVEATRGMGRVAGLRVAGRVVLHPQAGRSFAVGNWARLTLDGAAGRLRAPLVLRLLRPHDGWPAGTEILVAFSASARQRAKPKPPPDYPSTPFPFKLSGGLARSVRSNRAVSIAMRYLGVPYVWGGATPKSGFDCSGLVKYVFAQLGVPLVHYAAAQWNSPYATSVPANRLQAGDLVFFTGSDGTWEAPGHVGIYVGDGYLIDAPHTGARVRIDSLDEPAFADTYVGARRIVGLSVAGSSAGTGLPATPLIAAYPLGGQLFGLSTTATRWFTVGQRPEALSLEGDFLGIAATGPGALRRTPQRDAFWIGAVLAGLSLVLAGAVAFRRARSLRSPAD